MLSFDKEKVAYAEAKIGDPTSIDREATPFPVAVVPTAPVAVAPTASVASFAKPVVPFAEKKAQSEDYFSGVPPTKMITSPSASRTSTADYDPICPIASLNPYNNKWSIKARVSNKTDLRSWSNAKGEGKLFSMTLMDASGEIKCTAFNEAAILYFSLFEVNKIYIIGKATVKMARAAFGAAAASSQQSSYEVQLEKTSVVLPQLDSNDGTVPRVRYNFCAIAKIAEKEKDAIVDVIGIVSDCADISSITVKATQKQLTKREITLVDGSSTAVKATLWGPLAESFKWQAGDVYALKGMRVVDYQGKGLSSVASTSIVVNPDMREAYEVKGWFDTAGSSSHIESLSNNASAVYAAGDRAVHEVEPRRCLLKIKEGVLPSDAGDFFNVTGTIAKIKNTGPLSYAACPAEKCNKKVFEAGPGQWKCEKCNQVYESCNHRYMLTVLINDYSSNIWATAFDEAGQLLLGGRKAEEMLLLKQNDEAAYDELLKECEHKMASFRIKAKTESYQGEAKIKYSIMSLSQLNFDSECKRLIESISKF